jgi:hypothetical protein
MNYDDFVRRKLGTTQRKGIDASLGDYGMFPHQIDLTKWALRRGSAAIFADTGLGKTRMQIGWADTINRTTHGDVLILAPLAVAEQTVEEAASVGVQITHARDDSQIRPGINITNYDRLHKFDTDRFRAVVLDESSIIKHHDAKTLGILMGAFRDTPFKLCATATPAPNDWTELGTHAEFLGVRSRAEMLAEYFTHDASETQVWRLKGHARQAFWQWVASWGAMVRSPIDLGHDGSMYELPPLHVHQHTVASRHDIEMGLFVTEAQTLMDRRRARRDSIVDRVRACVDMVNADSEPWLIWCDLNSEGDALESAIPDAIQVAGADSIDEKERLIFEFVHGNARVMVSKPSIMGFGLNLQRCANMAFVGVTDSWEAYYQAVRRCWRFGQTKPVNVHIFASEAEGAVVSNLKRKEDAAASMAQSMAQETRAAVQQSVLGFVRESNAYEPDRKIIVPSFLEESSCNA